MSAWRNWTQKQVSISTTGLGCVFKSIYHPDFKGKDSKRAGSQMEANAESIPLVLREFLAAKVWKFQFYYFAFNHHLCFQVFSFHFHYFFI